MLAEHPNPCGAWDHLRFLPGLVLGSASSPATQASVAHPDCRGPKLLWGVSQKAPSLGNVFGK